MQSFKPGRAKSVEKHVVYFTSKYIVLILNEIGTLNRRGLKPPQDLSEILIIKLGT